MSLPKTVHSWTFRFIIAQRNVRVISHSYLLSHFFLPCFTCYLTLKRYAQISIVLEKAILWGLERLYCIKGPKSFTFLFIGCFLKTEHHAPKPVPLTKHFWLNSIFFFWFIYFRVGHFSKQVIQFDTSSLYFSSRLKGLKLCLCTVNNLEDHKYTNVFFWFLILFTIAQVFYNTDTIE